MGKARKDQTAFRHKMIISSFDEGATVDNNHSNNNVIKSTS